MAGGPPGHRPTLRGLARTIGGSLPYGVSARAQRALVRLHRHARSRRFREALRLVRAILPPDHSAADEADTAVGVLVSSQFTGWRLRALARCAPDELRRHVRFHGLEAFHDLYAAPQGVVLVNSEFGAGICVPLLLARLGYQVSSMEGMDHLRRAGVRGVDGVDVVDIGDEGALRVQELRRARNALQRGRILHIAGDAYGGRSGVVLSFRDRVRRFAEGFGYLALLANAPAVPVFAPLGPDGRIDIELLPPLPSGPADLPRRQRVALLVGAYARLLEQKWAELPANVFLSQLRAYAALPRAERPGRGPGPAD